MLLFVKGFPIGTTVLSFKFFVLENLKNVQQIVVSVGP